MPEKLTDQTPYVGEAPSNAIFHMVDPSDTTDDPDGSSFSVEKSQIVGTGNIPTKFVYCEVDFSTAGSTITKVQDVINALPTFTLGRTIYKFYTLRFEEITGGIGSGGGPGFRATIDFYELVKNFESLGSGGTQLTGAAYTNIRLTSRITNEDTGIGSRSLGEQGATPIEDVVDATGPHDVSPGFFNLFDLTRSGVSYTYLYVGEKEIVGTGEDPTVNGDYVSWPTDSAEDDGPPDEPINPQEYPQVTDAEIAAGTETGIRLFSPDNVKDMVDTHALAAVGNPTKLKGEWDASSGTFPGGGTAESGDSYIVSVSGTVDGVAFTANDRIIAITDNASTSTFAANWFKADYTDVYQTDAEIETAYNNQVDVVSQAVAEAGNSTDVVRWTPERIKQAILALSSGGFNPSTGNTLQNEIVADSTSLLKYYMREHGGTWSFTRAASGNVDKCFFQIEVDRPSSISFSTDFINENNVSPDTNSLVKITGYYEAADDKFYYSVVNNPTVSPFLLTAVVENANADQIVLTYNETLDNTSIPAVSDFTPSGGKSVTNVAISGAVVTLTVDSPYTSNDTITISYTAGTNPVQDADGNDAIDLSSQSVTNNISGKSAVLNGSDAFISIPNTGSMALTGDFAMQFDIKVADDTWPHRFVHKGDATSANYDFSIGHNASGQLYFQIRDVNAGAGHTYTWAASQVALSDGWVNLHLKFIQNSGGTTTTAQLWVNGVEDGALTPSESASFVAMQDVAPIEIGRRIDLSQYSEFNVDNIKLWNTAEDYGTAAEPERSYPCNDNLTDFGTDGTDATGTNITYSTDVP